jgi:hypothetical protein
MDPPELLRKETLKFLPLIAQQQPIPPPFNFAAESPRAA